jgi:hypothetical protein
MVVPVRRRVGMLAGLSHSLGLPDARVPNIPLFDHEKLDSVTFVSDQRKIERAPTLGAKLSSAVSGFFCNAGRASRNHASGRGSSRLSWDCRLSRCDESQDQEGQTGHEGPQPASPGSRSKPHLKNGASAPAAIVLDSARDTAAAPVLRVDSSRMNDVI